MNIVNKYLGPYTLYNTAYSIYTVRRHTFCDLDGTYRHHSSFLIYLALNLQNHEPRTSAKDTAFSHRLHHQQGYLHPAHLQSHHNYAAITTEVQPR
ncbi:hypothetical protein BBBOND_0303820 [Babesia bigemina]|uniref:Uncharacterized protein n=1 Tax=Babesia bigemina TaxID=5866 RepID=A0A061D7F6_BABBI|nr:hypothetical protein BBBOND_0303820 [Babesia bigemina]CDR96478.1 hypothetical protein BBBOND_0303820 [Babesia bigemina]|eukprot:XP_012768664.1 hypothetical protein BBBOND_0303820 [Babesia bigemina]